MPNITNSLAYPWRSEGTGVQALRLGGFGRPEPPREIETCSGQNCDGAGTTPTDLYCGKDERFLPLVRDWSLGDRVTAVVTGSALVLGCFVLAAVVHSWLPLFAVYAVVALAAVGLPLRLYPATVRVTVAAWFAAFAGTAAYDLTGTRPHLIMMTALFLAGLCALAGHSGWRSIQDALHDGPISREHEAGEDKRSRTGLAYLTGILVVSAVAGIATATTPVVAPHLLGLRPDLGLLARLAAAAALGLALLGAVVAGLADGPHRIEKEVDPLPPWAGPDLLSRPTSRYTVPPRRKGGIGVQVGDLIWRTLIRLANDLRSLGNAAARAMTFLVNCVITLVNLVRTAAILLGRALREATRSAAWFFATAVRLAAVYTVYAIVVAALPVLAIFAGAWLASLSAEETLGYLVSGPLLALLYAGALAIAGLGLLTAAWAVLAGTWVAEARDDLRRSGKSAHDSAVITTPYALLFVAIGGWVVGLPGTLGFGPIRIGWVTLTSTAILIVAVVWTQYTSRRPEQREQRSGATPDR